MNTSDQILHAHVMYERHIHMIKQCLAITVEMEGLLLDLCRRHTSPVAGRVPQAAIPMSSAH